MVCFEILYLINVELSMQDSEHESDVLTTKSGVSKLKII